MSTQDIQDILNEIMTSKNAKHSDSRLLMIESFRNPSDEYRQRMRNLASPTNRTARVLSDDTVTELREQFYKSTDFISLRHTSEQYGITIGTLSKILQNKFYVIEDWDYTDYQSRLEELIKLNKKRRNHQLKHRKFTDTQIQQIRDIFYTQTPHVGFKTIAKQYGISDSCLRRILRNETYYTPVWNYPNYSEFVRQSKK